MSFKLSSSICFYIRQILGQSWIYSKVDSSDKAQILSLRASAIAIAWQSINPREWILAPHKAQNPQPTLRKLHLRVSIA